MDTDTTPETDLQDYTSPAYIGSATYSPEDNKLRLYPFHRLDEDAYKRVKAAGFAWAPKQELFVAPMWTPEREDLLLSLCGEVGDEDKSLAQRAAERSERFEDLSTKRARDAKSAERAVDSIAKGIPFGQPILVGHHSEKHARRHAEKIQRGMERAVSMWETSSYWQGRASAALAHAEYKELSGVRYRRIKGLESDLRKSKSTSETAEAALAAWTAEGLTVEKALKFCGAPGYDLRLPRKEGDRPDFNQRPSAWTALSGSCPNLYAPRTLDEVVEHARQSYPRHIARLNRWINHYENRIAYEKAMLQESGAAVSQMETADIQPGGRVLIGTTWYTVLRATRRDGKNLSVRCVGRFVSIEQVKEYEPPTAEAAKAAKKVNTLGPIVNVKFEGCEEMTAADWKKKSGATDSYKLKRYPATAEYGCHRRRITFGYGWKIVPVFITDEKEVPFPPPEEKTTAEVVAEIAPERDEPATLEAQAKREERRANAKPDEAAARARELKKAVKDGVQVVAAPQLFPTPAPLARRMVELAEIEPEHAILEPSAGTGRIVEAIRDAHPEHARPVVPPSIWAVEVNTSLAEGLRNRYKFANVFCLDFLEFGEVGSAYVFDRILMNPPFANADDIRHIRHAFKLLAPGGRLVAICAGGPRQERELKPWVEELCGTWECLPAGTFEESGTGVNTVLLVVDKPKEEAEPETGAVSKAESSEYDQPDFFA